MSKNTASARRDRKRLFYTFNRLYRMHEHENGSSLCFYCQDTAFCLDHVPPLSWIESKTIREWKISGYPVVKVYCCKNCNNILGDKPIFSLEERARYIEKELLNKYDKVTALWSDEEIKEMSHRFQISIKARRSQHSLLLIRARSVQWRLSQHESWPEVEQEKETA